MNAKMATAEALEQQTYIPDADFSEIYEFLRRETSSRLCFLSGLAAGDRIEIPEAVHQILVQVVEAMNAGRAVSVVPRNLNMTTQQAADLLGVSRPTVVRLIESGDLKADRVGSRRRVLLSVVLAYRELRRTRQYAALDSMNVDIDDDDIEDAVEQSKAARKAIALRRANRSN